MKKFDSFDKLANYLNEDASQWNGTRVWSCSNKTLEFSEICNPESFDGNVESFKEFINNNQKETNDRPTN